MANEISLDITETVNKIEVTEDVTSINITPNVTTIELKGISIAQGFSATSTTYDGSSNTLGYGTSVSAALDHINTKGVSINKTNTMEYNSKINFTAAGEGQNVYTAMNLGNNDIVGINRLKINDAGQREGVIWPNWGIFESPIPLANDQGNFIVGHQYEENEYNPILEVKTDGIDVTGTITFDGGTTSQNLNFGDGVKGVFGDNSELQIFHQSSNNNSIIRELGEGSLSLQTNGAEITLWDYANNQHLASFITGAGNKFRYNGDLKLETTANGINVAGSIDVGGDITFDGWPKSEYELKGDVDGSIRFDAVADEDLSKGDIVYIVTHATQGSETRVAKAQANSSSTMPAFGLALNNVTSGNEIQIVTFGNLYGQGAGANQLDTSAYDSGTTLYVSADTAGVWTDTPPSGEGNLVQNIGKVVRKQQNNGVIKVGGAGRTNATPNLNNGNIFIGNSSNISTTASFDTTFGTSLSTRTTTDLAEGDNLYYTDSKVGTYISGDRNYGNITSTGYVQSQSLRDSSGSSGTNGQVLLSTGSGTSWGNAATTLNVIADTGATQSIDLLTETLDIEGSTDILTATANNKVTVSLTETNAAGTYGASQTIPQITVDAKGRITSVTEISGEVGPTGPVGNRGANGAATLEFTWESSINLADVLDSGDIQLNKSDFTQSGLKIRISSFDRDTTNVEDFVRYVTSSTNPNEKGFITLTNGSDPSKYVLLRMTTPEYITNVANETTLSVERVAGVSTAAALISSGTVFASFQKGADFGQFEGIDDLDDVDITTTAPQNDDILVWDTDKFVPKKPENQYVTVNSGPGVVAGRPYCAFSWDATNELPSVQAPDSDGAGQMPIIGFATETVGNNTVTKLLTFGLLKGLNTNDYSAFGNLATINETFFDYNLDTIYFTNDEADHFENGDRVMLDVGTSGSNPQGEDFPTSYPHITDGEWFVRRAGTLSYNGFYYAGYRFYKNLSDCLDGNSNYRSFTQGDVSDVFGENAYLRSVEQTKYLYASPGAGQLRRIRPKLNFNEVQQVATIVNYGTTTGAILVDIAPAEPTNVIGVGEFSFGSGNGEQVSNFAEELKKITAVGSNGDAYITFGEFSSLTTPAPKFLTIDGTIQSPTATIGQFASPQSSIIWGYDNENNGYNNAMFGGECVIGTGNNYNIMSGFLNTTGTNQNSDRNLVVGLENEIAGGITDYIVGGQKNKLQNTNSGTILGVNNVNTFSNGGFISARNAINYSAHYSVTVGSHDMGASDQGTPTSADQPNMCHWNGGLHTAIFGKSNTASVASDGTAIFGEQNRVGTNAIDHYQVELGELGSTKEFPYENGILGMPVEPSRRSFVAGSHNALQQASWSTVSGYKNFCNSDYSFIFGKDNEVGTAGTHHVQGLFGENLQSPQHTGNTNSGTAQIVVGRYNDRGSFDSALRATHNGGWSSNISQHFSVGTGTDDDNRFTSFVVVPRQTDSGTDRDFSGIAMPALAESASYSSDYNAFLGGVPVGGLYRNGNTLKTRLSDTAESPEPITNPVHIIEDSLTGAEFKALYGKRLVKVSTGGSLNFALFQPTTEDIGKSWTIVNADFGGTATSRIITLDPDVQFVRFMDGSGVQATTTDLEINSSGIVEIICIAANASGGSNSTPNFIIYGSGIST